MKQYKDLLENIQKNGTVKEAARENMPSTLSLFGAQFRHDLSTGFPLLTTKKLSFKNIVVELLWFLKGDTNIKYLVDNGCNIWNEDAYNYYCKIKDRINYPKVSFEEFVERVKNGKLDSAQSYYKFGDCGTQYGALWRRWKTGKNLVIGKVEDELLFTDEIIDQFRELIEGLQKNPTSRRHIITAWNPATLNDMALNACHALVQFNCRELTYEDVAQKFKDRGYTKEQWEVDRKLDETPKYKLDCQMYQRSADVFLGVPYNIASYALLTHIVAQMCNMVVGDFIHTFGDVHIYSNHTDQVNEQLTREERPLPTLTFGSGFENLVHDFREGFITFDDFINELQPDLFHVKDYNPHPPIKGKLSTGLK